MKLLGEQVTVINSTNRDLMGLVGVVVEDNRDTIRVRTAHGEKLVVKSTVTLKTDGFIIEGKNLEGTHAERTKRNK